MRLARRFLVSGRVQGVGFRFYAQDAARREGLQGHVRNLDGGIVEAVAEGEESALDRFEMAVRRGPAHARVEHVEVESLEPTGRDTGFTIR